MKKKIGLIIVFTSLFLTAALFHYQDSSSAVAPEEVPKTVLNEEQELDQQSSVEEVDSFVQVENVENSHTIEDAETVEQVPSSSNNVESLVDEEEQHTESGQTIENTVLEEQAPSTLDEEQSETIEASNDVSLDIDIAPEKVNLMNHENFTNLANLATKHNATLFGYTNSDFFFIEKDGEPIFEMSLGAASAPLNQSAILLDYFSTYTDLIGIMDNISIVAETMEPVTIDLEEGIGYSITIENEKIVVLYHSW
ncbi:hypothetical protein WAK64_14770 [Bacillus spongiae]|uniref:Uncharacterized protein n=1 Tax=Bacillus spongiae TaxID=2683610 RepID=A0ABU8HGX2_9BACI